MSSIAGIRREIGGIFLMDAVKTASMQLRYPYFTSGNLLGRDFEVLKHNETGDHHTRLLGSV